MVYDELTAQGQIHKFKTQYVIYPFYVDLYHPRTRTVIEIDGSVHDSLQQRRHDWGRTQMLNRSNYSVIRFTNRQVMGDVHAVVQEIIRACRLRLN